MGKDLMKSVVFAGVLLLGITTSGVANTFDSCITIEDKELTRLSVAAGVKHWANSVGIKIDRITSIDLRKKPARVKLLTGSGGITPAGSFLEVYICNK